METMIDNMILMGLPEVALKMEWVKLMFEETQDIDMAFDECFKLQKGE